MDFRTKITQELIGELLFVDQSAISRAISDLEEIIAEVLDEFVLELPEEVAGRVGMVDGSLFRCWSWADALELYSGKHKTTGHAHQFVWDLSGDLMHISDPLPGNTHDAKVIHETGLREIFGDDNAVGDKGYIGTGITQFRKPASEDPIDRQKEFSAVINKIRYAIECAIAHLKTWCMHADHRRPQRTYVTAFKRRPSSPYRRYSCERKAIVCRRELPRGTVHILWARVCAVHTGYRRIGGVRPRSSTLYSHWPVVR